MRDSGRNKNIPENYLYSYLTSRRPAPRLRRVEGDGDPEAAPPCAGAGKAPGSGRARCVPRPARACGRTGAIRRANRAAAIRAPAGAGARRIRANQGPAARAGRRWGERNERERTGMKERDSYRGAQCRTDVLGVLHCAPLPLGGRGWGRASRCDGPLPGFARRRFRQRGSGPPPGLPRKRGRSFSASALMPERATAYAPAACGS